MKIGVIKIIRITITVQIYTTEKIKEGAMKTETRDQTAQEVGGRQKKMEKHTSQRVWKDREIQYMLQFYWEIWRCQC